MTLEEFKKHRWTYSYTRRMSMQRVWQYFFSYAKTFQEMFGFDAHYTVYQYKNGNALVYFEEKEQQELLDHLVERFLDHDFIQTRVRLLALDTERAYAVYLGFLAGVPSDFSQMSNEDLDMWLDRMYGADEQISPYLWIYFTTVEDALSEAVRRKLVSQGYDSAEIKAILEKVSQPDATVPLGQERRSILRVALGTEEEREHALQKHWEEFRHMPVYDTNYEPNSVEYYKKELEEISKNMSTADIRLEIDEIEQKPVQQQKDLQEILSRFQAGSDEYELLSYMSRYGYFKDKKPFIRDRGSFVMKPLFGEIAKRMSLSLEEVLFFRREELKRSVLSGASCVSQAELESRIREGMVACDRQGIDIFIRPEDVCEMQTVLECQSAPGDIAGTSVYPGHVRGAVCVALSTKDFHKFKRGDILVTSATRPDFLSYMKLASAIVTDEGGMLSHAAITARELHVPCVVGTKNGTQFLKDGMMVEVDADKGIVKILKREKN